MRPLGLMAVSGLALMATLAGCAGGTGGAATSRPAASGACPTAPSPGDLTGWGSPASPPAITPILIANPGEITCGHNRVLFTFVDQAERPIATPDRTAKIAIYDLGRDPSKPVATSDGTFVWAIENARGDYIASLDVVEAGTYGAQFTTALGSGPTTVIRMTFDIEPSTPVVRVGDHAPASKTPTLADVGGDPAKISTDPTPDPALYQVSVDQALATHRPFVVIFATPKFCTSQQCGPTLDRIKPFVARYPGVAFIHVEPYKLKIESGQLAADLDPQGNLVPTDVTNQWGLLSEPWVFVVDRNGIVRGSFELIFSDAELTAALDALK